MTASQDEPCGPTGYGAHTHPHIKNVERAERAQKERQGMQVTNTGIRKLPELAARPKGKRK